MGGVENTKKKGLFKCLMVSRSKKKVVFPKVQQQCLSGLTPNKLGTLCGKEKKKYSGRGPQNPELE